MEEVLLEAQERAGSTKGKNKVLRKGGMIPAVVYSQGANAVIAVPEKLFTRLIHGKSGMNVIIDLAVGAEKHTVIVKAMQRNPLNDKIIHVDFQRISMKQKIEVAIPVRLAGESIGVKEKGGVLEHMVREIRVRCLPTDIPTEVTIDVTNLNIGDGVTLREMILPENVETVQDKSMIIVNVVAPTKEELPAAEAAVAGAPAGAEPEVITKGKKEEEGAEAAKEEPKDKAKPAEKEKGK